MIYLVTGGSGSGKSAYAEEMVLQAGWAERFYVATMEVFGEEGKKKVERHRKLRQGKGFLTVECPRGLDKLVLGEGRERKKGERNEMGKVVLLECMANLAANELFGGEAAQEKDRTEKETAEGRKEEARAAEVWQDRIWAAGERMKEGIRKLEEQCCLLVVVSSEVFSDGIDYGEETNGYIRLLGEMNCWLAERADKVVEVVYGIPVVLKEGDVPLEIKVAGCVRGSN